MVLVLLLSACEATVSPAPSGPGGSATAAGSGAPGASVGPRGSGGPGASPGRIIRGVGRAPLPLPTLTDPGEIGVALYDPTQVGVAVVSILRLLGIGIYDADGSPIARGNERAPGDPWLSEDEVRGLIDMGTQDLLDHPEGDFPYSVADLYEPLAEALPGLGRSELIAAYRDSYADHPDDFVPAAMLGQPMDASAQLTRTQLWLLYLDGFVEIAPPSTARLANGTLLAAVTPRFGTANAVLPMLLQPQGMSAADWVELRPHLPTIAWTIPFEVDVESVHEGHGGEGQAGTINATISPGQPFRSAIDRRILLQPNPASRGGVNVEWGTRAYRVLDRHGRLDVALPTTMQTDAAGQVRVTYTPKEEVADGHGFVATEYGSVLARANLADLIRAAYLVDNNAFGRMLSLGTLGGTRTEQGGFQIEWHTPGIFVAINNTYSATIDLGGIAGAVATAHREGSDDVQGVLYELDDGTYYGEMFANIVTDRSRYEYVGVLTDRGLCEDASPIGATQDLIVTARKGSIFDDGMDVILNNLNILNDPSGTQRPADDTLWLSFFPAAPPTGDFGCQQVIPFDQANAGLVPGGMTITADYGPLNDTRWSNPQMGYPIFLPTPTAGEITYQDLSQSSAVTGVNDVHSVWEVTVLLDPPTP